MLEAEAEDNSSRPSPRPKTKLWPQGQLVLEDLTPLTCNTDDNLRDSVGLQVW